MLNTVLFMKSNCTSQDKKKTEKSGIFVNRFVKIWSSVLFLI